MILIFQFLYQLRQILRTCIVLTNAFGIQPNSVWSCFKTHFHFDVHLFVYENVDRMLRFVLERRQVNRNAEKKLLNIFFGTVKERVPLTKFVLIGTPQKQIPCELGIQIKGPTVIYLSETMSKTNNNLLQ